ncbi:histone-lysine N-methyltransferase ASHR2 [Phoenix dactylifera]|uniref:Histone-lysine N-methyltransferase ASHR2 n=1 Tax=Phoenix dactylifera TaxID=42345 RepID=A0A8B7BGQ6_PHODC|nr:histone-lysine N-methyltransferase ASHR2 [Phoenix dactylifera]
MRGGVNRITESPMASVAPPEPLLKVADLPGRGRALVATRPIKPGEVLLSDSPLLLYPATLPSAAVFPFCSRCFRSFRSVATSSSVSTGGGPLPCPSCASLSLFCSRRCLSLAVTSSHSSWLCRALLHLPSLPVDLHAPALFLLAAYNLAASSPSDFLRLLSLEGALPDAPEAAALHPFVASLLPRPLPSGFSPELTAALLAKDKSNAFGLMEPFREEDAGERRVRAYGIYPNASFFNHDCLPNACRFDYVDGDGDRNTDIVVRAIHDIPEGREVCLSYFPVNWSYAERQRRLTEDYGFQCECDRCQVEKNWKDDEEVESMEEEEEEGGEGMETLEEENNEGGDGDGDFPHAYFFVRYLCDRENCGGTLAPQPPSPHGTLSNVMECNVCGQLRMEDNINEDVAEDGDGSMIDE